MAFPTTAALDDFNSGASQALTSRAGWGATVFWTGEPSLSTDVVPTYAVGGGSWNSNYWAGTLTDCEIWITYGSVLPTTVQLFTRASGQNTGSPSGFFLKWDSTGAWILRPMTSGTAGGTIAGGTQVITAGDSIGMSCIGSTHTVYYKSGAGAWTNVGSGVLATFASGLLAMEVLAAGRIDAFGGGAVARITPNLIPLPFTQGAGGGGLRGGPH